MAKASASNGLGSDRNSAANSGLFLDQDGLLVLRGRRDDLANLVDHRWCSIASCEFENRCGGDELGGAAQGGQERRQILTDCGQQVVRARLDQGRSQDRRIRIGHTGIIWSLV